MTDEIIIALISALAGGAITLLTTLVVEKRKEAREDRLAAHKERNEIHQTRPEMDIVEYKDFLSRPGYGIRQKCDIELFVAHIDHVSIKTNGKKGRKKREWVLAHFHPENLNASEWCCVIYVFKNVGKTDISTTDIICHYQKDTCIFSCEYAEKYMTDNVLNYSECHDKKIRSGDTVSLKLCYHKDRIMTGMISANMSIGMQDDNGRYWKQPLFAPTDKVYDSRQVTWQEYRSELLPDLAIECFKKPWLW